MSSPCSHHHSDRGHFVCWTFLLIDSWGELEATLLAFPSWTRAEEELETRKKRGEKESREIKGDSYNGPHYLVLFAKLNLIRSVIVRVREILKRTVVSD